MILNYLEISVAAKISVKFRGSIREIPKNRSKFTKNVILHLFCLPVQTSFSAVQLLDGFCQEYLDASKMLSFVIIAHANFLPMGQSQILFKNRSILEVSKSVTNRPYMISLRSYIQLILFLENNTKSSFFCFFNFDMV